MTGIEESGKTRRFDKMSSCGRDKVGIVNEEEVGAMTSHQGLIKETAHLLLSPRSNGSVLKIEY